MRRIVSLVVLVAILIFLGVLFVRVIGEFLLPIFLAVLLAVLFGPVQGWLCTQTGGRARIAAGLTTLVVLLVVLGPVLTLVFQASQEAVIVYQRLKESQLDLGSVATMIVSAGDRLGLVVDSREVEAGLNARIQEGLAPLLVGTTQLLGSVVMGLLVMIVSLYFFLADGKDMLRSVMRLSPLEDRYEEQLVVEFANVSRAIVLANLSAALVQGLLMGVALWAAGIPSKFLLMVLTMFLSMIPFVGAVAVWLPTAAWLYLVDGRTAAAVLMCLWGAGVISTMDNVIKPWILHGRSNLHPLLALLSVLGGVKALGPIGIFVGPMVVAFLATLLAMVQKELQEIGGRTADGGPRTSPAGQTPAG